VPFCRVKCPYCSFVSYSGREHLFERYKDALIAEVEEFRDFIYMHEREPVSVYIGGGSPLVLGRKSLAEIVSSTRRCFKAEEDREVTVEVNPGELDRLFAKALLAAGVTRLSIGVQSLDPGILTYLGRRHSVRDAIETFEIARSSGFDNVSCDLIFGVDGQSIRSWETTLMRVARLRPDHISAYELMPKNGVHRAPEVEVCRLMGFTATVLESYGYNRYEISNFAMDGRECAHNIGYWSGRDYLGFGAAAHSYYRRRRWGNTCSVEGYIDAMESGLLPVSWTELISSDESIIEKTFLSVRTSDGLRLSELGRIWNDRLEATIGELCSGGLAFVDDALLRLTPNGLMVSDEIVSELLASYDLKSDCGLQAPSEGRMV
jgi:oxygen-independent coproporphyrinogen-3 oxidase